MGKILSDVSIVKRIMVIEGKDEVERIKKVNDNYNLNIKSRNILNDLYEVTVEYPKKDWQRRFSGVNDKDIKTKKYSYCMEAKLDTNEFKKELSKISTMFKNITDSINDYTGEDDEPRRSN